MNSLLERLQLLVAQHFAHPLTRFNGELRHSFLERFVDDPQLEPALEMLLKGKQLTFVRHAESQLNLWQQSPENFMAAYPKNPSLYDPSITVQGFQQCSNFAPMSYDVVYISPSLRTLQTYENIPISCGRVVVTPLIRERNRIRAAVIGKTADLLRKNFPAIQFDQLDRHEYWWRHDYQPHFEKGLRRESDESLHCRMAFFLVWVLLQPETNVLIISHSAFLDQLLELEYFDRPDNCRPYVLEPSAIIRFFRRMRTRPKPKL